MPRLFLSLVATATLFAACSSAPEPATGTVDKKDAAADAASDAQTGDSALTDTASDAGPAVDTTSADNVSPGDTVSDVPAAKYPTCVSVGDCVAAACDPTPTADCEKPCLAGGSQASLEKAVPLLTCIQSKCQTGLCKGSKDPKCVSDCVGQMCTPELVACIDDGTSGTAVCGDALACFDKCDPAKGFFACMGKCYSTLSTAGKAALAIYTNCAGKASGGGQPPEQACIGELMSCLTGGKTGNKDCYEIFTCQEKCPKNEDMACMAGCLSDTTAAGQKAFMDAMPCFGDQSKMNDPVCAKKFMACINPTGTKTCLQTLSCQGACPKAPPGQDGSPSCGFACMHNATPAAAEALLKISPCGLENKTPEQAQACTDAMVGCANPSGTDTCKQIMACAQACGQNGSQDCMFACVAKGSVAGATTFAKFISCKDGCDVQCKDATDPQCAGKCLNSKCPTEFGACSPPT